MPRSTERGHRNRVTCSGKGRLNKEAPSPWSGQCERGKPQGHLWSQEQDTEEETLLSQEGEHRVKLEAGAEEGGKKPHMGKRGHRRPGGSPILLSQASHTQPTDHREGATYKTVHIWLDGAAFPRKTWTRHPGLQPPFKKGRRCDQELTSETADFPEVTAFPIHHLERGRLHTPWCPSRFTSPGPLWEV